MLGETVKVALVVVSEERLQLGPKPRTSHNPFPTLIAEASP